MVKRWNIDLVREHGQRVHGDNYTYVKMGAKRNNRTTVDILCNTCGYEFNKIIKAHIYQGFGCSRCSGRELYNYDNLVRKGRLVHGDKFDYTLNINSHFLSAKTSIQIICNICTYQFPQIIDSHINGKHGCLQCAGVIPYTYDILINKAEKKHGNKFDYSANIILERIGVDTKLIIKCNECEYIFKQIVGHHINRGDGCPDCGGHVPYTYEVLLRRVNKRHYNDYDYSLNSHRTDLNARSIIKIKCNKCNTIFDQSICSHVSGSGCYNCVKSKGERKIKKYLDELGINYVQQYVISNLPRRKYDFLVDNKYIIEFDGKQHFEYIGYFCKTVEDFINNKKIDVLKSVVALNKGFIMIRIGYNIKNIEQYLNYVFKSNDTFYISDCVLYDDHIDEVLTVINTDNIRVNMEMV